MADDEKKWNSWKSDPSYGDTLYRRATGELPEMDSSRAMASRLDGHVFENAHILDVGCGAGHYHVSMARRFGFDFRYTGVDYTSEYINLGRSAFRGNPNVNFATGDIYALPFDDDAFDTVICANMLYLLPDVRKPLAELVRVSRGSVVIRFLCGDRTFLVRDVHALDPEFDDSGEPRAFSYYNIYSRRYISSLLTANEKVESFELAVDEDFSPATFTDRPSKDRSQSNPTSLIGGYQANGYLLLPYVFLTIRCKPHLSERAAHAAAV